MDVFQKKYDEKFDNYFQNINVPNFKNQSSGMGGIMGNNYSFQAKDSQANL